MKSSPAEKSFPHCSNLCRTLPRSWCSPTERPCFSSTHLSKNFTHEFLTWVIAIRTLIPLPAKLSKNSRKSGPQNIAISFSYKIFACYTNIIILIMNPNLRFAALQSSPFLLYFNILCFSPLMFFFFFYFFFLILCLADET